MSYILENCKTIPRNKANRYLPQHVVILASQNDVALGVVELLKAALEIRQQFIARAADFFGQLQQGCVEMVAAQLDETEHCKIK